MFIIDFFREKYYLLKTQKLLKNQKYEKANLYISKAILIKPSANNFLVKGIIKIFLSQYEDAEKIFAKALEKMPDNEYVTFMLVKSKIMQRKWEGSKKLIDVLVENNPQNEDYKRYSKIINDPITRNKYVKSEELIAEADKSRRNKDIETALKLYKEAFEYSPKNAVIANNIGTCLIELKKPIKEAYKFFEIAYKLNPNNINMKKNYLFVKDKLNKKK